MDCGRFLVANHHCRLRNPRELRMIRNVIFDIGGVFIEWDRNKAFREFGFSDETIRKIQQSMLAPEVWVEEDLSIKSPEELLSGFQARCPECAEEIRYFWEHYYAAALIASNSV